MTIIGRRYTAQDALNERMYASDLDAIDRCQNCCCRSEGTRKRAESRLSWDRKTYMNAGEKWRVDTPRNSYQRARTLEL